MVSKIVCRLLICIFLLSIIAVSGCGGSKEEEQSSKSENQKQGQQQEGGVLKFAVADDIVFHPVHGTPRPSAYGQKLVYDCLTRADETLKAAPGLAKSWSVSEDDLTWTFELFDNVTWHDGEPFTARDVKFTLDNLLHEDTEYKYYGNISSIEEVKVVDDHTVQLITSKPFPALPIMLAYYVYILPEHKLQDDFTNNSEFNRRAPVGTGPFKVVDVKSGSHVELEAHKDYHHGTPKLDGVIIKILGDQDTVVSQLMTGELDLAEISPGQHLKAVEGKPNIKVHANPGTNYNMAMINHDDPIFDDVLVRRALIHALDREALIEKVMNGYAQITPGTISPSIKWAYADHIKPLEYDPEKAMSLLEEAGWTKGDDGIYEKNGKKLSFTMSADNAEEARKQTGVLAQQYFKEIGIDAELEVLEWGTWLSRKFREVPEMTVGYWSTPNDPDQTNWFHSEGSFNYSRYNNPELDKLWEEARQETDREKRKDLYYQIQEIQNEDVPIIVFYYNQDVVAANEKLSGLKKLQFREALCYTEELYFEQ